MRGVGGRGGGEGDEYVIAYSLTVAHVRFLKKKKKELQATKSVKKMGNSVHGYNKVWEKQILRIVFVQEFVENLLFISQICW